MTAPRTSSASGAIREGTPWIADAAFSLLASPDGADLLLAWTGRPLGAPQNVHVARLSCAGTEMHEERPPP